LDERPPERHVQDLHAAADRQHWDAGRQRVTHHPDLEVVAVW
jgi:hypothetical protein